MRHILILHASSFVSRATTIGLLRAFSLENGINAHYHHVMAPPEEELRRAKFDIIFINYCVFTFRQVPYQEQIRTCYEWVAEHPAVKIAFPMDDCYRSAYIEEWIRFFGATAVYTALYDYKEKIYPRLIGEVELRPALTGYVDASLLPNIAQFRRPMAERPIMVGSRVASSPVAHGRFARKKSDFALGFARIASERGLTTDVSTRVEDAFVNMAWFDFLGRCRATPAMKGGYGLVDPWGKYRDAADKYVRANPGASYDEVALHAFPDADDRGEYSCVSPRIFEAAMMHTVQLMPPSNYLECLAPWRHYIPLKDDFSNSDECIDALMDVKFCEEIAKNCYDMLIESDWFTARNLVQDVLSFLPKSSDNARRSIRLSAYKKVIEAIKKDKRTLDRWERVCVALMSRYIRTSKLEREVGHILNWFRQDSMLLQSEMNGDPLSAYKRMWAPSSYIAQFNLLGGLDHFHVVVRCLDRLQDPNMPINVYWPWAFSGETPFIAETDQIYSDPLDLAMDRHSIAEVQPELEVGPEDPNFHTRRARLASFKWCTGLPAEGQHIILNALDIAPPAGDQRAQRAYDGMAAAILSFAPLMADRQQVLSRLRPNAVNFSNERLNRELELLAGKLAA